jgi:hypothetical protein
MEAEGCPDFIRAGFLDSCARSSWCNSDGVTPNVSNTHAIPSSAKASMTPRMILELPQICVRADYESSKSVH